MIRYLYHRSGKLLVLPAVSGVISGLAGAAVIAVISQGLQETGDRVVLAWAFFGLCLVFLLSKCCSEMALLHATQTVILDLRVHLSRKVLATPLKKLQELDKHRLLVILTKDVDTVARAFQLLPQGFGNLVLVAASLGYLAVVSWQLFLLLTASLVVCGYVYHLAERRPRQKLSMVREQTDLLYQDCRDLIEGSKELQLNARRGARFVEEVVAPDGEAFRRFYIRGMTGYIWVSNAGSILFYWIIGLLLFMAPLWLGLRFEALTAVTLVLLYLVRPIGDSMLILPILREAAISLQKIEQLDGVLSVAAQPPTGPDPFLRRSPLRLELQSVSHRYIRANDDRQFVLGPVDMSIHRGELLFITGGNGSGKTTLAMLLLGLYEPEYGRIIFNGQLVRDANREHYRQYFSAVFSDFHLFEHLLVSDRQEADARAAHYIEAFDLGHKVRVVDGKFSTLNLSGGQRKRLALIVSYLEDRPIFLFDEWAADQDPVFKRVFYTELLPDLKGRGKTVIVITHDDAYFSCADRLIKLVDGRVETLYSEQVTLLAPLQTLHGYS